MVAHGAQHLVAEPEVGQCHVRPVGGVVEPAGNPPGTRREPAGDVDGQSVLAGVPAGGVPAVVRQAPC